MFTVSTVDQKMNWSRREITRRMRALTEADWDAKRAEYPNADDWTIKEMLLVPIQHVVYAEMRTMESTGREFWNEDASDAVTLELRDKEIERLESMRDRLVHRMNGSQFVAGHDRATGSEFASAMEPAAVEIQRVEAKIERLRSGQELP